MDSVSRVVEGILFGLVCLPSLAVLLTPIFIALARLKGDLLGRHRQGWSPAVSLVVPLARTEEHGIRNMRSYLGQEGLRDYEVIFVAENSDDPSAEMARTARLAHPDMATSIVYSGNPNGRIAKMHNLRTALPLCRHEIVVFADSDVEFTGPGHLLALTRSLVDDRIGLVTAAPIYRVPVTLGGFLLATMINADLWGYFGLLYITGNMNVANGALLATRRTVLAEAGDLEDMQHQLLNDSALARKVRAVGGRVALCPLPAVIPTPSLSVPDWWRQIMRWHVGMRSVLPSLEYMLYGFHRSGVFLGLLCFLLVGVSPLRPLFLVIPVLTRMLSCSLLFLFWRREPRALIEIPLAPLLDLLSPVIWLLSWVEKTIWWRGRAYRIGKGGIAEEIVRV